MLFIAPGYDYSRRRALPPLRRISPVRGGLRPPPTPLPERRGCGPSGPPRGDSPCVGGFPSDDVWMGWPESPAIGLRNAPPAGPCRYAFVCAPALLMYFHTAGVPARFTFPRKTCIMVPSARPCSFRRQHPHRTNPQAPAGRNTNIVGYPHPEPERR